MSNDQEMPSDVKVLEPGMGDDGKFHVPSQFEPEPDGPKHWRMKAGLTFTYHRGNEEIACIDFQDFMISEGLREQEDVTTEHVYHDARCIVSRHLPDGLQPGDIEQMHEGDRDGEIKKITTFTEEDIDHINLCISDQAPITNIPTTTSPE